jgi:hypothetical protein
MARWQKQLRKVDLLGHVGTCAYYFRVDFFNMLNVRLE